MTRRVGVAVVGLLVLLAVAVGGVVLLLESLDIRMPQSAHCTATVDGVTAALDPDQAANAAMIAAVAEERGLPARAVTIALATAMQESELRNIDYGDRDSIGLFQQRPSQGWGTPEQIMDPIYSTNTFYDALTRVGGYLDMEVTDAAQAVQRSAFAQAYAQHEDMARLFASALTGNSTAALSCQSEREDPTVDLAVLLARDYPSVSLTQHADGSQLQHAGDDQTRQWAVAHWAIATATLTGISQVQVGDQVWVWDEDGTGAWSAAAQASPSGVVVVR
ncbi:MAG: hypothetical protein ACK5KU_06110 [Beutenbergiaceae bacterium]